MFPNQNDIKKKNIFGKYFMIFVRDLWRLIINFNFSHKYNSIQIRFLIKDICIIKTHEIIKRDIIVY